MAIAEQARSDDWKDKYFKALNEFDHEGRRRAEQLTRVSRELLGVLERFRGADDEFDHELDTLGRSRQLDEDPQQARLRELVAKLARSGQRLPTTAIEPPAERSRTLTESSAASYLALVSALADAPAGSTSDSAPLRAALGELKSYLEVATTQAEQVDLVTTVAGMLSDILAQSGTQTDAERTFAAREALQTLVDRLSLPEAAQIRLTALTPQLQHAQDGATVRRIARELADVLVDHIDSMHAELASLNGFLIVIKNRLGDVAGFLLSETSERSAATAARSALDTAMGQALNKLREQTDEATSLDQLKHDIQAKIALIDGNVATYLQTESARAVRLESEQAALVRQLDELESQSDKLRRKLADAQALAVRDSLTGLPNRHAYNERIKLEQARWQRDQRPLSLAVLDIDRFKSINDTFGHPAGDRVLKHLSRELAGQIRGQDFFGRYGGEEFVLILPDTSRDNALRLVDKLRRHIETCRFKFKDSPVNVTFSCGVAQFRASELVETVIARADAGLYAAKNNGRNRVEALD